MPRTVSVSDVVCVALALVPVTVTVYVPATELPIETVIVDVRPAATVDGLKVTVVPAGWPLADRATFSAEPGVTLVEIVDVPDWPCGERQAARAVTDREVVPRLRRGAAREAE